ncbi:hypothetical protein [Sinomonas albida]|uniref:hypothetical protein n=1 Tax=Sinomonas albida TaxID=369942 RepID=UPI001457C9DA|nr:hypothetical protein [Sinomonas albida]
MDSERRHRPADYETVTGQERLLASLMKAGLSEQQARAQIARLSAGDVWGG